MVDSIGTQGVVASVAAQDRLVAPVAQSARPAKATAQPGEAATRQLELTALAADFGKPTAAEEAHVDEVRRAVRDGKYPITPETIADRMLALKLYWSPKK